MRKKTLFFTILKFGFLLIYLLSNGCIKSRSKSASTTLNEKIRSDSIDTSLLQKMDELLNEVEDYKDSLVKQDFCDTLIIDSLVGPISKVLDTIKCSTDVDIYTQYTDESSYKRIYSPIIGVKPEFKSDWIEIGGLTSIKQIERINLEIESLWQKWVKNEYYINENNIKYIDSLWQETKSNEAIAYINQLLNKEKNFRESFQSYIYNRRNYEYACNQIEKLHGEISTLENQVRLLKDDIELNYQMKRMNKENFKTRLSNIPFSIVVIGRMWMIKIAPSEIKNSLTNEMIRASVKEIIGARVNSLDIVVNNEIVHQSISEITQGNAQVSDSYFRDIIKPFGGGVGGTMRKNYTFQVHRIDVFPFNDAAPQLWGENKAIERQINADINIYFVDGVNRLAEPGIPNSFLSLDSLKLTQDEIQVFIATLVDLKNKNNSRIESKIEDITEKFNFEECKIDSSIKDINAKIDSIKSQITGKGQLINGLSLDTLRYNELEDSLYNIYKNDMEDYKKAYSNKITLVNKFEVKIFEIDNIEVETLKKMALNTFKFLNQIIKTKSETILEISKGVDQYDISLNTRDVEYLRNINHFKVLYLLQQEDISSNQFFILNIAYKINYTTKSEARIDEQNNSFICLGLALEWKAIDMDNLYSYLTRNTAPKPAGDGWRLPNQKELNNLYGVIDRYNDIYLEGDDVFSILNWKRDYYITNEGFLDNLSGQSKIRTFNFNTAEKIVIQPGDSAPIIWVREINSNSE